MCTAATYKTKDFYFGRNLDYEMSYGEEIIVTPRNYPFKFRHMGTLENHYAMIGMALVVDDYPLYYDGINEKGLGIAGLNFVGNAHYKSVQEGKENIASFEFISWILGKCASVKEARDLIGKMNMTNDAYSEQLPTAELHWLISDANECITVESVKEGIKVYDNPVGVLTNNPPFDKQLFSLNNYRHLSEKNPDNLFSKDVPLDPYSRGMGGIGLPGDLSSQSRFIKVAFTKVKSLSGDSESESISQFLKILGSGEQQRGCCEVGEGKYEITLYSSCCNADKGIYYYTTYENSQITGVDMNKEDLEGTQLVKYPLVKGQQINMLN